MIVIIPAYYTKDEMLNIDFISFYLLTVRQDNECGDIVDHLDEDEGIEHAVIALADTIVDPGTVVIEALDTAPAEVAMEAARCPYRSTVRAYTGRLYRVQNRLQFHCLVLLQVARVFLPHYEPQHHSQTE